MTFRELFETTPKMVLGPILVLLGLGYFVIADPPKTICDTQFDLFKEKQQKYIYGTKKNNIQQPAVFLRDFEGCRTTNSSGGCFDWLQGLKALRKDVRLLPSECGSKLSALDPFKSYIEKSFWIFTHISWNDTDVRRRGLYHWLDAEDIAIFCSLKREWVRLNGRPAWKQLEVKLLQDVLNTKKINDKPVSQKEAWERTVLSQSCGL